MTSETGKGELWRCMLVRKEDQEALLAITQMWWWSILTGTRSHQVLNLRKFTSDFSPFCIWDDVLKWQRIYLLLTVVAEEHGRGRWLDNSGSWRRYVKMAPSRSWLQGSADHKTEMSSRAAQWMWVRADSEKVQLELLTIEWCSDQNLPWRFLGLVESGEMSC